jgi:hypothetical protein
MLKSNVPNAVAGPPDFDAPGLPGEARINADSIPPEYWRAFSLISFTMNRFIVDHVMRVARLFDNDIESMILFGVLAHLNVAHLIPPGSSPSSILNAEGGVPDSQPKLRPVRIRDLTQITGRPRETIRRRLERLETDGRVLRVVGGYVLNVASIEPHMQTLTINSVRNFMQTARVIDGALKDASRALAKAQDDEASATASS